jgi:acyl carrier protein
MENFESTISEILEVDSVEMNDDLESFDAWDSLTILSIIALCDSEYNVELTKDEIENSETIRGLKELVKSKM